MNNTLSKALQVLGEEANTFNQLLVNLTGIEGKKWRRELRRFVRGDACWVDPTASQPKLTLYLHDKQKNGVAIQGYDLEAHLRETGLIDWCLSLEDEVVKSWLENPSTYPEEYKGKAIFFWKSQQGVGRDRDVAYLIWSGERVVVRWGGLGGRWFGSDPVLLAS